MFKVLFDRFLESRKEPSIHWDNIKPPSQDVIVQYDELLSPREDLVKNMLNKLVIIKLNGVHVDTSIDCTRPMFLIDFLDFAVRQVEDLNNRYGCDIPLVLMNSFSTHEDTLRLITGHWDRKVKIHTFVQNYIPRINRETMKPEPDHFYPPGHGDFYQAFYDSGLLRLFIEQKREFCFVSSIDNLGASADLNILNILTCENGNESPHFVMEVKHRTTFDINGGVLVDYEGKPRLIEVGQVPKDRMSEFRNVMKFNVFNTNNLWMHLPTIETLVKQNKLELDIIVNEKHDHGIDVIQLKTAIGAAIRHFDRVVFLDVPRSRFLPVGENSDALRIRSNSYLHPSSLSPDSNRASPSVKQVEKIQQSVSTSSLPPVESNRRDSMSSICSQIRTSALQRKKRQEQLKEKSPKNQAGFYSSELPSPKPNVLLPNFSISSYDTTSGDDGKDGRRQSFYSVD